MNSVFADTSYYIALVNPRDMVFDAAGGFTRRFHGTMYTTEYVLLETANRLSRSGDRGLFLELFKRLNDDPDIVVVEASKELFKQGLNIYAKRPDKDWSLTDCISFVVMKQHGLTEALTADRHFDQAGFRALLKA